MKKKHTPRNIAFQAQHQEPLLLPTSATPPAVATAATVQQDMGRLSKYLDPDRHVEVRRIGREGRREGRRCS